MMAPDYAQWHGMFEVAHRFYTEMVPQIREQIEKAKKKGNHKGAKAVQALLDQILNSPNHRWFIGKMSAREKARRKAAAKAFKKRYLQNK